MRWTAHFQCILNKFTLFSLKQNNINETPGSRKVWCMIVYEYIFYSHHFSMFEECKTSKNKLARLSGIYHIEKPLFSEL